MHVLSGLTIQAADSGPFAIDHRRREGLFLRSRRINNCRSDEPLFSVFEFLPNAAQPALPSWLERFGL